MEWSLVYNAEQKHLSVLGISEVVRKLKNQAVDLVTLRVAACALDAPILFEPQKIVKIFRDEQLWFTGVVTKTPIYGNSTEEFHQYTLSGGWWYLDNIIYQQQWKEPVDPDSDESTLKQVTKSRLILGQNVDGDAITIGEQIQDVIDYVNSSFDAPVMTLSPDVDLPIYIPFDECKDLSCAEVIKRLLRWIPDAITFFDYTTDVPVLYILRRMQLPSVTLDIHLLSEIRLMPRYDLQIQSVVLKFEKTHKSNGKSWKTLITQKYPTNATGKELQSLVMTIALEGIQATYIKQELETELIQIESANWWRKHLPGLHNVSDLTVEDPSRNGALPNELISGTVADWMHCSVEQDMITAKISYATPDEIVYRREVAVKINTTNAQSKTYRSLVSYITEENVPADLAQNIYEGVSQLQYEGQLSYVQTEISGTFLGRVVNLSGGRPEWSTMNAVVQMVEEQIETGAVSVILGPAKHLGPDDLSELTKSNRNRVSSRNFYARSTAEAGGNSYVEQGKYGRIENSSYGSGRFSKLSFCDQNNTERKVIIDTNELGSDVTVRLREEDVSDSGILKKRYSLSSEPFEGNVTN